MSLMLMLQLWRFSGWFRRSRHETNHCSSTPCLTHWRL